MHKTMAAVAISIATLAMSAAAQTGTSITNNNDGNSGTAYSGTGTIPVYKGSATLGNSVITQSNGNVGIGTINPSQPLEVNGNARIDASLILTSGSNAASFQVEPPPLSRLGITTPPGNQIIVGGNPSSAPTNLQFTRFDGAFWRQSGVGYFDTSNQLQLTSAGDQVQIPWNSLYIGGNVGIGTTDPGAKLEVNGNLRFSGDAAGVYQTTAWTGVLCGGDYAEAVNPTGDKKAYAAGDVLVISDEAGGDVEKSSEPYSTKVVGVFASKRGVIGRRESLPKNGTDVPMAMVGIVPTKVTAENGPIHRGDLLVTSSQPGLAMKCTDRSRMLGAVIGKALGSLDSGTGVIEVVVTLQ